MDQSEPPSSGGKAAPDPRPLSVSATRVRAFLHSDQQRLYWRTKREESRERHWHALLEQVGGDPERARTRLNTQQRLEKRVMRRFEYSPLLFVERAGLARPYTKGLRPSRVGFSEQRLAKLGCHIGPPLTATLLEQPWHETALKAAFERRPLCTLSHDELVGHAFGFTLVFLELAALFDYQQPENRFATRMLRRRLLRSLCFLYVRPWEVLWELVACGRLSPRNEVENATPYDAGGMLFMLSFRLCTLLIQSVLGSKSCLPKFPPKLSTLPWSPDLETLWNSHPLYPSNQQRGGSCGCAWLADAFRIRVREPGTYIAAPCAVRHAAPIDAPESARPDISDDGQ